MIFFSFDENKDLAKHIAQQLGAAVGLWTLHTFPDDESQVRVETDVAGKSVYVVCSLDHPNPKFMPLSLLLETLKSLGAKSVTLIAPYLAYMRQDKAFHAGEGVSAAIFAKMLSAHCDALITIDPHLHRIHDLNEIYTIIAKVLHADDVLADWVKQHVSDPFLIGPDAESEQWVSALAERLGCDYAVLTKTRHSDTEVEVALSSPSLRGGGHQEKTDFFHGEQVHSRDPSGYHPTRKALGVTGALRTRLRLTPILCDDMISTGHTLIAAAKLLNGQGFKAPICLAVHGLFAGNAFHELQAAGVSDIVTCNTVSHPSNQMDVSKLIADCILTMR